MISVVHDRCLYIGGESSRQSFRIFCGGARLRISVGIPDICEFRAIVFTCQCAGEKGPTREHRASQKPKSLTLQKFCPDFTTDLKESWILCHSVDLLAQLCTPANSASSASFLNSPKLYYCMYVYSTVLTCLLSLNYSTVYTNSY